MTMWRTHLKQGMGQTEGKRSHLGGYISNQRKGLWFWAGAVERD